MGIEYISSEDVKILNLIKTHAKTISNLYNILLTLDVDGQKNSEEYFKYVEYLKNMLEIENELYSRLNISIYNASAFCQYIIETTSPFYDNRINDFECILSYKENNYPLRRIISKFRPYILSDQEKFMEIINTNYSIKSLKNNGLEDVQNFINKNKPAIYNLSNDIVDDETIFFLTILDNIIKNFETHHFSETIIFMLKKIKYDFSMIRPSIESTIVPNNFDFSIPMYTSSKINAQLNDLPDSFYNQYLQFYLFNSALSAIEKLHNICDADLNYENMIVLATVASCELRATLSFTDQKCFEKINTWYEKLKQEDEYITFHQDDKTIPNLVNSCFGQSITDRENLNQVSFIK